MKKLLILPTLLLVFGFGCADKEPPPKTPEQLEQEVFNMQPNGLIVHTQETGQTVSIAETKFVKPGFVAVIEQNNGDETVLGYSSIIPAGQKQNQKIALTVLLEPAKTYIARLYDDTNGDTEFKLNTDEPIYELGSDKIIEKIFQVASTKPTSEEATE